MTVGSAYSPIISPNGAYEENAKSSSSRKQIGFTRPYGLSLADRACLALAIERKATVYTTDRSWKNLSLEGLEIEVIR